MNTKTAGAVHEERSGLGILIVMLAICAMIALAFLLLRPLSDGATERARQQSMAIQSQAAAQQAAERERSERERLSQETSQRAAELRAETTMRTQNSVLTILAAGLIILGVVIVGGGAMYALDWADSKRIQRALLLLETQRQAQFLQLPGPSYAVRTWDHANLRDPSDDLRDPSNERRILHAEIQSDD
jgi:Flp pilus assembly protein TadB